MNLPGVVIWIRWTKGLVWRFGPFHDQETGAEGFRVWLGVFAVDIRTKGGES